MKSERTAQAGSYPLLLKQLLHAALLASPDQEIVYRDTVRYDYRSLAQRIARLANGLAQLGIDANTTVGILDWDSHRYLESYFAIPGLGAVLHMVNIRLSPEQILYTINHAQDDVLLVHADFLPLLESLWDRLDRVPIVILLADDDAPVTTTLPIARGYETLLASGNPTFQLPDIDEDSCATTFYTTGTTGLPKGVAFSHRQLVLHTLAVATALGTAPHLGRLHRADVYMPITPMFHVHAWGLPFVATTLGIKQVYPGRYAPEMLLRLIAAEGVTFSHCVPTLLQMILGCPLADQVDLSTWKVVIGGSALPKALARAALERGIDVFAGYGMSETGPILTIARPDPEDADQDVDDLIDLRTRTGFPIPLVDLRAVAPDLTPLPHDGRSTGEVVVRAPWLTQAYRGDPAASERLWQGGCLHTGDIGHIGPDGALQITDRIKDVIKTGGEWISSLEIEDLLAEHPAIAEAAVIAEPDAKWGERPVAIVVLRPDAPPASEQDLRTHLTTYAADGLISRWAVPARIVFVDALAKTSVGKLDKKLLRARHAADQRMGAGHTPTNV